MPGFVICCRPITASGRVVYLYWTHGSHIATLLSWRRDRTSVLRRQRYPEVLFV